MARIFTIGHSTHSTEAFIALLDRHGIVVVADVRAHPGSRRLPHFGAAPLAQSLAAAGIEYAHLPELGGRRRPLPGSPNAAWDHDQFQGYADHMATEEFANGLSRLEDLADRPAAAMCAEGLWWRCHRRLLSDALLARGHETVHVLPDGALATHELTDFAVVELGRVTYPPAQASLEV